MENLQTAYIEKTGQSVKGWIEFNAIFDFDKCLGFIPKFYAIEALIPFEYFSKIKVDDVTFTGYCGTYSIIGKEPMKIGEMNDESNVKSANGLERPMKKSQKQEKEQLRFLREKGMKL